MPAATWFHANAGLMLMRRCHATHAGGRNWRGDSHSGRTHATGTSWQYGSLAGHNLLTDRHTGHSHNGNTADSNGTGCHHWPADSRTG